MPTNCPCRVGSEPGQRQYLWPSGWKRPRRLATYNAKMHLGEDDTVVATQIFFSFTPKIGEDSHFDSYFSNGLKPPTRWSVDGNEGGRLLGVRLTNHSCIGNNIAKFHGFYGDLLGFSKTLHPRKLTWLTGTSPCSIGNTSSNRGFCSQSC